MDLKEVCHVAAIVVDAGHGGRDSGAVGPTGVQEKDMTLLYAKSVAYYLGKAGHNVIMTRETDRDFAGATYSEGEDLAGRVKIANDAKADLFVSIHMNGGDSSAKGTETYSYPGSQNGARLADLVQKRVVFFADTVDRGAKTANFYVLRNTAMTAILVEVAFISNPEEEQLLTDHAFRVKVAVGVFAGVQQYLGQIA